MLDLNRLIGEQNKNNGKNKNIPILLGCSYKIENYFGYYSVSGDRNL